MANTQSPKILGILFAVVGIPLIVWSASGTHGELEALNTESSSHSARVAACEAKSVQFERDPSARRDLCGCIVRTAESRGAFKPYGGYDESLLEPIISQCVRWN